MPIGPIQNASPVWQKARTPVGQEHWLANPQASITPRTAPDKLDQHLKALARLDRWRWPDTPLYFLTDPHADSRALIESLALAGLLVQTGPRTRDFEVTAQSQGARVLIGGDCLGKGPNNLKLLATLTALRREGLHIELLAGNHDLRLPLALHCLEGGAEALDEYFFVRMDNKTLPLLAEIWHRRLAHRDNPLAQVPDKKTCRHLLFPRADWPARFTLAARELAPRRIVEHEILQTLQKQQQFKKHYKNMGMNIRQLYAAAVETRALFMQPDGEYSWFLSSLKLLQREGSFLFVHAGVSDSLVASLAGHTADDLNAQFQRTLSTHPGEAFLGALGNAVRTRYRRYDRKFRTQGAANAADIGICAVVHGHRSQREGQRIGLQSGLLHLAADVTLDRHTRRARKLRGRGAGIVCISPSGCIEGMSGDYPRAKRLIMD